MKLCLYEIVIICTRVCNFLYCVVQGVSRKCARLEGDQEVLVQAPGQGALRLLQLRQEEAGHAQRVGEATITATSCVYILKIYTICIAGRV